jgi:hypothetical protein
MIRVLLHLRTVVLVWRPRTRPEPPAAQPPAAIVTDGHPPRTPEEIRRRERLLVLTERSIRAEVASVLGWDL